MDKIKNLIAKNDAMLEEKKTLIEESLKSNQGVESCSRVRIGSYSPEYMLSYPPEEPYGEIFLSVKGIPATFTFEGVKSKFSIWGQGGSLVIGGNLNVEVPVFDEYTINECVSLLISVAVARHNIMDHISRKDQ